MTLLDGPLGSVRCIVCGMLFAFPDALIQARICDGHTFWCPRGHQQCFTATRVLRIGLDGRDERLEAYREAGR